MLNAILASLAKPFRLPDLRKRIITTVGIIFLVRLIAHIPLPGINHQALAELISSNQFLGLLDIFTGGTLSRLSIAFMGVGPYITASIIFQLLTYVIPKLEEISKEGAQGQMVINQYTRMLAVPLSIVQSFGLLALLKNANVLSELTPQNLLIILFTTTAATILLMWLGELISEYGVGNGISLIIMIGIIASVPINIRNTYELVAGGGIVDIGRLVGVIAFAIVAIITVALVVVMTEAERRIPVSYARRLSVGRTLGRIDSHLPIKMNTAGVIPIIFALSVIIFPSFIARFLQNARSDLIALTAAKVGRAFSTDSIVYGVTYFILVVAFTYFYTSIVFQPEKVAENLQKQSGFIPGFRPGLETAQYIGKVVKRITLPGALFLGVMAVLPFIIQAVTKVNTLVIGGTGVLIVVSVVIETAKSIRAQILTRRYELT